ncbi:hypothetical protein FF011L_54950 [Roseimaritima multifibrata]|uniref:3-keto-disaccharide hydrolase domain-containing protein n=1 Tax=Roseimaritima multifibrata TaxID=1930274 RepID=A0A517MP69_9BACT|nr:hypothetical protein [Roseimaritima multifibrata]QDS96683.1 hypothetical protein FF011L_54950 [Roseimaritima multifibrata]
MRIYILACFLCVCLTASGTEKTLLFQDSFDRDEPQAEKEQIGNGWTSNSVSRAGGNKQVDLRDNTLHIKMHATADHAVSVKHDAEFKNGIVELRFMLEHPQDVLGLNFADLKLKSVHAGHLFKVDIGTRKTTIADLKTGVMDLKTRELRLAKKVSPQLLAELATKRTTVPHPLKTSTWYSLTVSIAGDKLDVVIDDKAVASFQSPGIEHPTKRTLRISVPKEVVIDDLQVFAVTD